MVQETLDRRLSAVERRTGKLETEVRDLDTYYAKATYRMERDLIGIKGLLGRMATAVNISALTEDEIDAVMEEPVTDEEIDAAVEKERQQAEARIAAGGLPRHLSDMARKRAHVS